MKGCAVCDVWKGKPAASPETVPIINVLEAKKYLKFNQND